jgi:hypothetical protein
MSTLELQQELAKEIAFINDEKFLIELKVMIDTKLSMDVYRLSDYQRERVKQARIEWENGTLIDNDDLFKEIDQWLNTE